MAVPARSARIRGVTPKSFILAIVVIALVLALFFIPEIVAFQKGFFSEGQRAQVPASPTPQTIVEHELSRAPLPAGQSPIEEVAGLMDSGFVEKLKAKKLVSTADGKKSAPGTAERDLTWAAIKGKASGDALRAASREALNISKSLPVDKPGSRYALFSFASGVDMILDSGEKAMSAAEAVRYLDVLRLSVTRAMSREQVNRAEFNRWLGLNLGPTVGAYVGTADSVARMPFTPRPTLTSVIVRKTPGRRGRWDENRPEYVTLAGFMLGKDIKQAQLYLNGNYVRKLALRPVDVSGRRTFKTGRMNARGVYTLRIISTQGEIYQKSYAFYPRVRKFPWGKGGVFEIPFQGVRSNRLDRFFTFRPGRLVKGYGAGTAFDDADLIEKF